MTFICLTKEEVRYKYKKANNKEKMIKILADLTCSSEKEMIDFLFENITRKAIIEKNWMGDKVG